MLTSDKVLDWLVAAVHTATADSLLLEVAVVDIIIISSPFESSPIRAPLSTAAVASQLDCSNSIVWDVLGVDDNAADDNSVTWMRPCKQSPFFFFMSGSYFRLLSSILQHPSIHINCSGKG